MGVDTSQHDLIRENQSLAAELTEARELLYALRKGEVDALVSSEGDAVYGIQLIALAVDEAETYVDALSIVLKKLCEATGFVYGDAWATTSNGRTLERTSAWYGACSEAVMLHESLARLAVDPADANLMHALSNSDAQWIHAEDLLHSPRAEAIRSCGMQTGLVLALMKGRELIAVLGLWKQEREERDNAAVANAWQILKHSAAFVQRKREQEALHQTLVTLERTVQDRSREMAELYGRLSDQSAKRELAERLSRDRQQAVALSEQELTRQTMLLQSILDSMAEGVLVTASSGSVLQCNPAARKVLGAVPAHVAPGLWPDIYGMYEPDKLTRIASEEMPLVKALRGEKSDQVEIFIRGGMALEGQMIAMSGRPLLDASGAIYGAVAVFHDITQHKREEEERIQNLEEQRDTLVREVHHRIKNNLAAVIELMNRHASDHPDIKLFLKQIEKQLYAIATMYGLEASRDAGIYLRRLVCSVSANAEALFGVRVNTALGEYPLQKLKLREDVSVPVALVLNELLVNACKHGNDEQVEVRITRHGSNVVIEVINSVAPDARIIDSGEKLGSGIALVRALLPHKAHLEFRQSPSHVLATVSLAPDIFGT
jgi:two-component sensor histidine kinase/PAS domain-containing protein